PAAGPARSSPTHPPRYPAPADPDPTGHHDTERTPTTPGRGTGANPERQPEHHHAHTPKPPRSNPTNPRNHHDPDRRSSTPKVRAIVIGDGGLRSVCITERWVVSFMRTVPTAPIVWRGAGARTS